MPGHIPPGVLPVVSETLLPHQPPPTAFIQPGTHTTTSYGMETLWLVHYNYGCYSLPSQLFHICRNAPQLEPAQDPRRHMMSAGSHSGLLPHPQAHIQVHVHGLVLTVTTIMYNFALFGQGGPISMDMHCQIIRLPLFPPLGPSCGSFPCADITAWPHPQWGADATPP